MNLRLVVSLIAALSAGGLAVAGADAPPAPARAPRAPQKARAPARPPAPTPPPVAPAEPPRFERDDLMRLHMHENFDLLRAIERLLIRGQLEEARTFARAIAEIPDPPSHGPWAAQVVAVRDRAAALARATTIDQACRAEAQLAAACADCHTDSAAVALFRSFPPVPPDRPTVAARMLRHRWAADRMWEGIVGAANEPWTAALEVLAAAPLPFGAPATPRALAAKRLQRLAGDARAKRGLDATPARATAYGEILATCASCHMAAATPAPTPPSTPPPPTPPAR